MADDNTYGWSDTDIAPPSGGAQAQTLSLNDAPPIAEGVDAPSSSWSEADLNKDAGNPFEAAWQGAQPTLSFLKNTQDVGHQQILQGYAGMKVIRGEMDYSAAKAQFSSNAIQQMKNPYPETVQGNVLDFIRPAAETVPFMVELTKGAAIYGATGTAIGGTAGMVGGPALSGLMAKAGMQLGSGVGAYQVGADIMGGQLYMELRENGIDHDTAKQAAVVGGAVMSYIEVSQIKLLAGAARKLYVDQLVKNGWLEKSKSAMLTYLGTIKDQSIEEVKQEIAKMGAEAWAGFSTGVDKVIPSPQDFVKRVVDNAVQGAQVASVFGGVAMSAGSVAGKLAQPWTKDNAAQKVIDILNEPTEAEQQRLDTVSKQKEKLFAMKAEMDVEAPATKVTGKVISGSVTMTEKVLAARDDFEAKETGRKEISKQRNALATKAGKLADKITAINKGGEVAPDSLLEEHKAIVAKRADFGRLLADATRDKREAAYKFQIAKIEDELTDKSLTEKERDKVKLEVQQAQNDLRRFKVREAQKLVESRRAALEAKIEENVLSTKQKEGLGKPTAQLIDRLTKLKERVLDLNALETVLGESSLTEAELDQMIVNIPTKTTKYLINRITKKLIQTNRQTELATRGDITRYQNLIAGLVARSGIKLDDRQQFAKRIRDAKTKELLGEISQEIDARIQDIIYTQDILKAEQNLTDALLGIEPRKRGKKKQSSFEFPVQNLLNTYKDFIVHPEKGLKAIETRQDAIRKESEAVENATSIPLVVQEAQIDTNQVDAEDKYWIAVDTLGLTINQDKDSKFKYNGFNADQLNYLAKQINKTVKEGKQEKAARIKARKAARLATAMKVGELIQGTKPATKAELENNIKASKAKIVKRTAFMSVMSWDQLMVMLDQHNTSNEKLVNVLDIFKAVDAFEKNRDKWVNRAVDNMTQIGNEPERVSELLDLMTDSTVQDLGTWFDENGEEHSLIINGRADLIDAYLQTNDTSLNQGHIQGNKYTLRETFEDPQHLSFKERVVASMTPADYRVAMGVRKTLDEYFTERVNPVSIEETGLPLDMNPTYSGKASRIIPGKNTDENSMGLVESIQERSLVPGSTIPRTKNGYAVRRGNAVNKLFAQIAEFETYHAYKEIEPLLRTTFGLHDNQQIIKSKYGDKALAAVELFYTRVIGTRRKQLGLQVEALDKLRGKVAPMYTGGKWQQIPKQIFGGIPVYLERMNAVELATGIADYALNRKKADAILNSTGFHTTRGESITREVQERSKDTHTKFNKGVVEKAVDILNSPPMVGDLFTTRPGNWALYLKNQRDGQFSTNGEALLDAVSFGNRTQSSSLPDQVTNFEEGSFGRAFFMFLRQPHALFMRELNGWRRWISNPDTANTKDVAKMFAAYRIANVAFIMSSKRFTIPLALGALGYATGVTPDEQKEYAAQLLRAAVRGNVGGVVFGDMIEALNTIGTNWAFGNKEKIYEPQFIPLQVIKQFEDLAREVAKGGDGDDTTPDTKHHFKIGVGIATLAAIAASKKYGGSLPVPALSKMLESFFLLPEDQSESTKRGNEVDTASMNAVRDAIVEDAYKQTEIQDELN